MLRRLDNTQYNITSHYRKWSWKQFRSVINSFLSGYSSALLFHRQAQSTGQKTELSLLKVLVLFFLFFFFGVTPVGNRWPRTGIESLGLALDRRSSRSPWNSFASTSALPPTNASGINREHSVAMQCFSSAYFCKKTFAIFTILNANNSQLEQSHRKTLENSLLEISENSGNVATQFPYTVWKFRRKLCKNILGHHDKHGQNWTWQPEMILIG